MNLGKSRREPMRILAVIPGSDSVSAMIFARRQVAAAASRGHVTEIFDLQARRSIPTLLKNVALYRERLRQFRPDVVHAHYGSMTGFFSVYGAIGLAPVVVTFRGSDLNPVPSVSPWNVLPSHGLSQVSAWCASQVICVSAELRDRLWFGHGKVTLIPTGVDTTKFYPSNLEAARQALGWELDRPVVLFNAGHSPQVKRLDIAQEVVGIARRSVSDIRFVVLDGSADPDTVPILMQASDCLLFTSDFEGSPTVIEEAMASNLPIVSVAVGDVPERLRDVLPSYVLPRNPVRLAEALVTILRGRPRSNGHIIAKRDVAIEPIMTSLEQVYARAAASFERRTSW